MEGFIDKMMAIFETALKLLNKFVHPTRYRVLERRIWER